MTPAPLISVIIPVYNGARYLGAALASVLAQTYRPIEILVIDDGSTDSTQAIVASFPAVRYARQEHAGVAVALNHGIALASGEYLSFLDGDDLWTPGKLAEQMECFVRDPALDMVFGQAQQFYIDAATSAERASAPADAFYKGTMLISRAAFLRVGLYDPQWQLGDFVDWYLRARDLELTSLVLDKVVLKRRIHSQNMGKRERDHRTAYLHILKQSLDRRRS